MSANTVSFSSADWKFVVLTLEKQLSNARDALENKLTSFEDTAFYRGRIALAKELLRLPELPVASQSDQTGYDHRNR